MPRPQALVVEDDKLTRQRVGALIEDLGFGVDATPSLIEAEGWIVTSDGCYSLAVVDWDMSRSPEAEELSPAEARRLTAQPVLKALDKTSPWTKTVVFAGQLGVLETQRSIQAAHAGALIQDKALGEDGLTLRVRRLLSTRFGDLELDRGVVRHSPSGLELPNGLAASMLVSHPHWVHVPRDDRGMVSQLFRFRRWLEDVGSSVEVYVTWKANRYHLRERGSE